MTKQNLILGILAHVDAGKTTLSEALLHITGAVRKAGRVDHKDAFLDTNEMEKERGITIFSKQARFTSSREDVERSYTLLDTPGHVDFSTEMERVLGVLDCAVLVISAADGVNGQVRVLWRLLDHYKVPTFLFVNKMDQDGADRAVLLSSIKKELSTKCVDVMPGSGPLSEQLAQGDVQEEIAVCDDALLNAYLEGEPVTSEQICRLTADRKLFPVLFGAALREQGVPALLECLDTLIQPPVYGDAFGARIFKITRDGGARLTWMKLTGGRLSVKTPLAECTDEKGSPEKVEQIRFYSGSKYEARQEAVAGEVCAVTGLTRTRVGQGIGAEASGAEELLQPVLRCAVLLPPGEDLFKAYRSLRTLEEEDPTLHLTYDEEKKEITAQIMGQVQKEILQRMIRERLGLRVSFGEPSIIYKETIARAVEGVGHFEPLRHYAEVHLLLEPGVPGSGLVFENRCRADILAVNWQRLIMTHLEEKRHRGVLTGAEITDMKISLLTGRAHLKHTEGGDFRQATYRAVRQGLMMTESVLLEPFYSFRMEIPQESLGRALTDLQQMGASFTQPDLEDGRSVITGSAPVSQIANYAEQLAAYTRGEGQITCTLKGYEPCTNAEEIIAASGYDPELDLRNPPGSVFCAHGAGTPVPWYEVRERMHVDSGWRDPSDGPLTGKAMLGYAEEDLWEEDMSYGSAGRTGLRAGVRKAEKPASFSEREAKLFAEEDELRRIFERTYGPIKSRFSDEEPDNGRSAKSWKRASRVISADPPDKRSHAARKATEKEYLLIDGYNIVFAWEDLRELAAKDIMAARDKLIDMIVDFAGFRKEHVILVFDAYKVRGGRGEVIHVGGIDVIYTKEAETADLYIEKAAHELSKRYKVTVATSDAVEQVIIYGAGAYRMSAQNLLEELVLTKSLMREHYEKKDGGKSGGVLAGMSEETAAALQKHLESLEE
ncbi:MAG: TetM/TetW/TetO/TetS family tetracycline resistance ribosomal protection protein [Lachnospiraceae bacterium]|nr:TetM/TetW/TetO/TetS family tetracycline resistance ribosomal protection protein [Lachnospiraceae bacterium]